MTMNFNGATQQLDFIQADILNAIIPDIRAGIMGDSGVRDIQNGICFMLSIEWLRLIYKNSLTRPSRFFGEDITTPAGKAYYMQIANNFSKASADIAQSNAHRQGLAWVSQHPSAEDVPNGSWNAMHNHYVKVCIDASLQAVRTTNCASAATAQAHLNPLVASQNCKLFITTVSPIAGGGGVNLHQVAICSDGVENTFFDPNYGVYQINNLNAFLQDYFTRLNLTNLLVSEIV